MNKETQPRPGAEEEKLLDVLGECLEYPTALLSTHIKKALATLTPPGEVRHLLSQFNAFLESTPREQGEEIYTQTFDLEPASCLYVGYHLFGDTHRRGIFMAKLEEHYRACGLERCHELPDHLTVLLRLLRRAPDAPDTGELIQYCIIPALRAIRSAFTKQNPYLPVIDALRIILERERGRVQQ